MEKVVFCLERDEWSIRDHWTLPHTYLTREFELKEAARAYLPFTAGGSIDVRNNLVVELIGGSAYTISFGSIEILAEPHSARCGLPE